MTIRRTSTLHDLIRGGDTWRHQLRMLLASLGFSLLVGLVIALAVAGTVFYYRTEPNFRAAIVSHYEARFHAWARHDAYPIRLAVTDADGHTREVTGTPAQILWATETVPSVLEAELDRAGFWGLSAGLVTTFAVLALWLRYGRSEAENEHLRGVTLTDAKTLARLIRKRGEASRITLGGVPLRRGSEMYGVLLMGAVGAGKTLAIREQLDVIRGERKRAIVYDPTGELIATYFRDGRDILLNPLDARSPYWPPWAEVRNSFDYANLAKGLIPDQKANDPFWQQAARLLFEETLKRLAETGEATNQALIRAISLDSLTELHERLAGTAGAALVDPTAERTAASVKMTAVNALRSLKYLPGEGRGKTAFSIRGFVEREDDAWLFLSAPADQREALKPLIACWLDVAVRAVMTLAPVRAPRLWLVLDEVASLSKIDSLAVALTEARKYGLCPVLGLQSAAQLRDIYGRDAAQVMLGMLQTWLVLRVADGESAKYLSESLGAHEMQEKDESLSFGAQSARDGTNLHSKRVQRVAVLPSEIQKLADREGYLALPGPYPIAKIELSIREKPAVAEAFISRELAAVKVLDVVASVTDRATIAPVRPIL